MTDAEESNDDITNEEDTDDEMDDYDETDHSDLKNRFTLEETENIIECVDEHPNARFATISNRFRKIKSMNYITKFREYIENDGTRLEKLKQIKAFMFDEFYLKRTIKKEALHDTDLELYAIQKTRELNWPTFKAIQPVTSANGHLLDKFLLILQEKENTFGTRVQQNLIILPNVVVRASKSGKSSDEKHHAFLNEVLRPLVGKKFLLFLDAWKTQTDLTKFRAVFPNQDSQLLIFPEGSTDYIQPQDLSLFRSWRFIHEKIEHYTHINRTEITLSDRQYFINMHSVIHNQLSAPQFKNLIKNGFIKARITNETNGHIEKLKDNQYHFFFLRHKYGVIDVDEILRSRHTIARTIYNLADSYRICIKQNLIEQFKQRAVTICPDF
ncbi:unnamed protein product [Rotaria sordida]|uniref:DDE-1 domain-containing protein n=1 Tax=Rotaria sordida TaxID=392033 RepID=A0A815ZRF2_9BILA|nr:unnamed protein product [Rotaria sordida]CAF1586762.1 unnamed protein product [Rotaria sordida]